MSFKTHKHLTKKESTKMMEDVVYCLTVIFVVHILMHIMDDQVDIMDEAIIKLALYSTLGITAYHLIMKRILSSIFNKRKKRRK